MEGQQPAPGIPLSAGHPASAPGGEDQWGSIRVWLEALAAGPSGHPRRVLRCPAPAAPAPWAPGGSTSCPASLVTLGRAAPRSAPLHPASSWGPTPGASNPAPHRPTTPWAALSPLPLAPSPQIQGARSRAQWVRRPLRGLASGPQCAALGSRLMVTPDRAGETEHGLGTFLSCPGLCCPIVKRRSTPSIISTGSATPCHWWRCPGHTLTHIPSPTPDDPAPGWGPGRGGS